METPEDAENAACNGLADCSKSILLDLPWEILVIILELVASEAPSADLIPFDDKKSLSVESFSSEPPQVPNDWHATGTLVCCLASQLLGLLLELIVTLSRDLPVKGLKVGH
jgi:hypothetical protein